MTASSNGVGAFDAKIRTNEPGPVAQAAREQRANDLADAVTAIELKLDEHSGAPVADDVTDEQQDLLKQRITALEAALKAARAEADRARAEAQKGSI